MDATTQAALRALNRRFYDRFAAAFDASREHPWPGWERLLQHLERSRRPAPRVLDVGCGNGRLATFLGRRWSATWRYLGLDSCRSLLDSAAKRLRHHEIEVELRHADVLDGDTGLLLAGERFELIALFGVLHHVPGARTRRRLLCHLAGLLAPGGILAATVWQADRSRRKAVTWTGYNRQRERRGEEPIDLAQLEAGDLLLGWGGEAETPRYCHFPPRDEVEEWIAALEPLLDRFEADGPTGRDNLYLVFGR